MMGVVTQTSAIELAMAGTQEWLHQFSLLLVAILILYNKNVLHT